MNTTPFTPTDSAWGPDERQRLLECSTEPLATPGRIQSFGTLIAVDAQTDTVVVASEDAADTLGLTIADIGDDRLRDAYAHGVAIDPISLKIDTHKTSQLRGGTASKPAAQAQELVGSK